MSYVSPSQFVIKKGRRIFLHEEIRRSYSPITRIEWVWLKYTMWGLLGRLIG